VEVCSVSGVGQEGTHGASASHVCWRCRQIIHTEGRVGVHKALSAAQAVAALNSLVCIETHLDGLAAENAVEVLGSYDIVLDCSDNPPTRYLVSAPGRGGGRFGGGHFWWGGGGGGV
jgi:adenylyltransferase/sulfurtransferase